MNGRQFNPALAMHPEPEHIFLNDIYAKKLKLVEQIQKNRQEILPSFFPSGPFRQWDVVLEEMKLVSYEMRQQKSLRLALTYHTAKKVKKVVKHKNTHNR